MTGTPATRAEGSSGMSGMLDNIRWTGKSRAETKDAEIRISGPGGNRTSGTA